MSINTIMSGPRSKIKRANRHIDELQQRTAPLDRSLYEITNGPGYESIVHLRPTQFQVTFRHKENIPEALAAIIGDAIGNLREALDHLASGIVRQWGSPPSGPLYFPVTPRKDLITHSGLTAIEQALPGSKKLLLDEIRPHDGPNEPLWNFYTLNKDDKHNFFIPTVLVTRVSNINIQVGSNRFVDCGIGFDAARPYKLVVADIPIAMEDNFNTSVDVKFGGGTPFESQPVIPTLIQISEIVSETLNAFERLIISTKL